ncbi:DUF4252 domain-containing protein [Puteibacter caeruleilacunae]|nr:DUF4252 domain-containing protein [Puteibacter caeruleilacunae]
MTKIAFLLGVLFSMLFGEANAQGKSQRIYDRYADEAGFSMMSFSKNMLDVVNLTLDDEGKKVTGDLKEIKVLYYNPAKGTLSPTDFKKDMVKRFPAAYKKVKVDDVEEKGNTGIEMRMLGTKRKVKEFHVVLYGEGLNALISFYGNMDVRNIDEIRELGEQVAGNNR